jgi:hypothetical protein
MPPVTNFDFLPDMGRITALLSLPEKRALRRFRRRSGELGNPGLADRDLQITRRQSRRLLHRRLDQARQQLAQPPSRRNATLGLERRTTLISQAPIMAVRKSRLRSTGGADCDPNSP